MIRTDIALEIGCSSILQGCAPVSYVKPTLPADWGEMNFVSFFPIRPENRLKISGWRLINAVNNEIVECQNNQIGFSISIGMATSYDPFITPTQLLDRADTALYKAKRSGRNRLAFEDDRVLCCLT